MVNFLKNCVSLNCEKLTKVQFLDHVYVKFFTIKNSCNQMFLVLGRLEFQYPLYK
jgi:hypothetical protein